MGAGVMSYRLSRIQGRRAAASGLIGGPQTLVRDSFDRANANVMGNADTGQAWTVAPGGTWGIASNQCAFKSGTGFVIWVDAARSDLTVQANCFVNGTGDAMHIACRVTDESNLFYYGPTDTTRGHIKIIKFQSGSGSDLAVDGTLTQMVDGDLLTLVCLGTSIKGYLNSVLLCSGTSSFNQTATKVGLVTSSGISRADNFLATSP